MKKAVVWTAAAKYTTAVLQLVFAAILSRILTPDQYGTVAVITVFSVFFQLFCDMGFGTAVIQDKGLTEKQTNDIFSWTLYLGLTLQLLFIGASFPISYFYDDPIYIPLGIILSLSLLINAMNMIPNAVMLKQKRFKIITVRTICSQVVTSLLTVFLAYKGWGVYAIVFQTLLSSLIIFLWNEFTIKLKFNYTPEIGVIKRIWGYSVYQFLAQLLNYFNRNLDNLLIGKFLSKADLGQYNKSYTLMQMPISYIPGVVGPALHPILSDHQKDPQYIYDSYMRIVKLLSLIGCFISIWLYYTGDELIIILFGNQWYPAIMPFKILALSVWFQLLINTVGPIFQSIGNTKLLFKTCVLSTIIIVSLIALGCFWGSIVSVAVCVTIAYVLNFFIGYFFLIRVGFNQSFCRFVFLFRYEVVFFMVLFLLTYIQLNIPHLLVSLCVKTGMLVCIYIMLLFITGQYRPFLNLVHLRK